MFLGLRHKNDIDLAEERPGAKPAEIPGYKAVYRSDKSARVGGLSLPFVVTS